MRQLVGLLVLVVGLLGGCASMCQRCPTPAADFSIDDLEAAHPTPPGEKYYLLMFGSQDWTLYPKYTHTWVTVVRVPPTPAGQTPQLEEHTISWMPASLNIRPLCFEIEPGINLGLHETLHEMLKHHEFISVWGPYEIRAGLYHKLVMQQQYLEEAQIGYQLVDTVGSSRGGLASNCIHAVSDVDETHGRADYPLTRWGFWASKYILKRLIRSGAIINPDCTHDWLLTDLGLTRYRLLRRDTPHVGTRK